MQKTEAPVVKDLVLVGGGHAHVKVLKTFGMKPVPGLRLTLIARDIDTPYSGMLPGFVAGHYDFDQCHIDLGPLAEFASARLYHGAVTGLDLQNRQVLIEGRPAVSYDLLSINIGSSPRARHVPGALQYALMAKPIDRFLQQLQILLEQIKTTRERFTLVVVGGGAGGVELVLALQHRVQQELQSAGEDTSHVSFILVTKSRQLLPSHHKSVQSRFVRILGERNIEIHTNAAVTEVTADSVQTEDGRRLDVNAVVWVTDADAPQWPGDAGLAIDDNGFICVNDRLQSVSHADIFAAGDIASLPNPRPKSGVFAVRQGKMLAHNLRRAALAQPLKKYRPQKNFLGLISTGSQYAIASRGNWSCEGAWVWTVKDWIDRRFMDNFNQLPVMRDDQRPQYQEGIADEQAIKELSTIAMRCGGCGAKVGATVLARVMQRLPERRRDDVLVGREAPDDCAMFAVPEGKVMVQSVDYFRAFIPDNYLFGAIAANHALGDLFAMGAEAQSALAIATVPYGRERIVEESLYELLAGALSILDPTGAVLAGGHSSEGAELAFGLTVNGLIEPDRAWRKSGLRVGNALVLTKPVGTGTLFAAAMRRKAKGRWIDAALQSMLHSNQQAAACLQKYAATACTDLTGFGLIGHLIEMTRASQVDARLNIDAIPLLDGAVDTVKAGILSSLQPQNLRLRRAIHQADKAAMHPAYALLFDPQTAGGLLAGVPAEQVDACVLELKTAGYKSTAIIGQIVESSPGVEEPISIELE